MLLLLRLGCRPGLGSPPSVSPARCVPHDVVCLFTSRLSVSVVVYRVPLVLLSFLDSGMIVIAQRNSMVLVAPK
jgi:hypothetical protein